MDTNDVSESSRTLGWWMDERRGELQMTWDQLAAAAGGISTETLRHAASGRPMRTTTRKAIEKALQWGPDYVERIARGEEPIKLDRPDADERDELLNQMDAKIAEAREILRRIDALGQKRETG